MTARIAYEAYKNYLRCRTRNWHKLKEQPEHATRTDKELDRWIKKTYGSLELKRYFMGSFEAMPEHTLRGWESFAESAQDGAEAAWNSYTQSALQNFHQDPQTPLPLYNELLLDQQDAVLHAVQTMLEDSYSIKS